jgi:6-phosphogluconolactonase
VQTFLYIGTHRRAHRTDPADIAFGVYGFRLEPGRTSPGVALIPVSLTETPQPGWIVVHPHGRYLYACNEVHAIDGTPGGAVSAFQLDALSGAPRLLNSRATPALPCHCAVDATGRFLLVASFGGGSVHLFPLLPDGQIGSETECHRHTGSSIHPRRQRGPHAHAVAIDPANRFVLVPDLGVDRVVVYQFDHTAGRLVPRPERDVPMPPGSGPRHLVFDAAGRRAYLMNEMSASVTVFDYDHELGALSEIQTLDLMPEGFAGLRSGAAIGIHPSGRYLYATTRSRTSSGEPPVRGLDSLVCCEIGSGGRLRLLGRQSSGGEIPRSLTLLEGGRCVLVGHQGSGTVMAFDVSGESSLPQPLGAVLATPVPVCLCPV